MEYDPLAIVERFASRANAETAVTVDVSDKVLACLQANRSTPASLECEYVWIGAGSLLAACAASLVFWIGSGDDSLWVLAQPFITVMP